MLATRRVKTPVVAVGNLTLGGSGKSPLVEYLLRMAGGAGLKGVAVSRGYGRRGGGLMRVRWDDGVKATPEEIGDEPCMIAGRNPTLAVYVGNDRAAAARLAEIVDRPDVIVLDDAFQHLRLARDLNVLLIDADRGLGNGLLLPLGDLREPVSAMARADVILITKAGPGDADGLARRLARHARAGVPVFRCDYRPRGLIRLDGEAQQPLSALRGKAVTLVCAIAQPEGFRRVVEEQGARVHTLRAYRDHHPYTPRDLAWLDEGLAAAPSGEALWLTTEKDAVKLRGRLEQARNLWVLEMEVVPEPACEAFFFDFLSGLKLR
jgi:tetraacyldisaccharide 4'-kinase